jgi:hypothetical protein
MLGRPALLWQLCHESHEPADCLIGELADGRVYVRIVQCGKDRYGTVFDTAAHAMEVAHDIEQDLLRQGWTRAV